MKTGVFYSITNLVDCTTLHTVTHGSLLTSAECLVFVILGAELGGQRRAHIPVRVDNQKEMARRLPHLGARRPAVALSAHGTHGFSPCMVFIPVIQPLSESAWATACKNCPANTFKGLHMPAPSESLKCPRSMGLQPSALHLSEKSCAAEAVTGGGLHTQVPSGGQAGTRRIPVQNHCRIGPSGRA